MNLRKIQAESNEISSTILPLPASAAGFSYCNAKTREFQGVAGKNSHGTVKMKFREFRFSPETDRKRRRSGTFRRKYVFSFSFAPLLKTFRAEVFVRKFSAINYAFFSSSTRRLNSSRASATGCGFRISTPAPARSSSGSLELPPARNPRYASSSGFPPRKTRWESAIAAESPIAYLYT